MEFELMRNLVINTNEPLLIENILDWQLLKWNTNQWQSIFKDEKLPFRCGKKMYTLKQQFENTTNTIEMTFSEFIHTKIAQPNEWFYFDYKYLKEWLINVPEIRKHINWKAFGFPELSADESTIWIGSEGAHTPCHIDTYGCNIVAQIYGKKRWILFPPMEDLHPTRVPYEESSIYSKLNFYSPNIKDFKNIENCRSIILNPGDVLILPHRWWHYVENLELAISINTWIQLPIDHKERLKEAIVQTLVSQLINTLEPNFQSEFINPINNQQRALNQDETLKSIQTILLCMKCYKSNQESDISNFNVTKALQNFKNIKVIEQLSKETFITLLEFQKNRFSYTENIDNIRMNDETEQIKNILDAMLHSDVINLIEEKLLNK